MKEKVGKIVHSLAEKKLQSTAISLQKHYKPTVSKELERANMFAYELYFKGYPNESLTICGILEEEKFNGNHDLWTWIQSALFLKCWILQKYDTENSRESIEGIIKKVNDATIEYGDDEKRKAKSKKTRNRRLNGSLLHYDKIEDSIKENDRTRELAWRIGHFKELLYIYFLGGSEEFSIERVLKELNENDTKIRGLIKIGINTR